MIFGTILGIQLDQNQDTYHQESVSQATIEVDSPSESDKVEASSDKKPVEDETTMTEVQNFPDKQSVLTKLGHGLNNVVSGLSEKAVSGLK